MAYKHCMQAFAQRNRFPPKLQWNAQAGALEDVTPRPGCSYTRASWPPRARGRGESLTSPRRIEAKLRAGKAVKLRLDGYSFEAIARKLGYGHRSSAWCAIRRAVDRLDYTRYLKQVR